MSQANPATDWRVWRWLTPGVVLLGFLFRDLVGGEIPSGADVGLYSLPRFQLLAQLWRSGLAPGWNPYMGLGGPMVGDATLGFFYPGNLLVLLASPQGALAAYLVLHLGLGLAGVFALARRLGISPAAASLAATAFALGGVSLGQLHTPIYVAATGWLPWALLGFLRYGQRPTWGRGAAAAIPFALMFLAGAPENTVVAGALALAFAPLVGLRLAQAVPRLLGVALFAMGLSAIGIVPTWFVYLASDRGAGFPLDVAARWSLHPFELIGLLLPRAFAGDLLTAAGAEQEFRVWHSSLYMGVVPAACLAPGLAALVRRPAARPLLILSGLLLVLAFGVTVWPSPYALAHRFVPGASSFRFPAKLFVPVSLTLAIAAGVGVDRVRAGPGRRALTTTLFALGAAALLLVGLGLVYAVPGVARSAWVPAFVAVGGLAALRWVPGPRLWQALLLLLAVDLALAGDHLTAFAQGRLLEQRPRLVEVIWQQEAARGPQRVLTARAAFRARVDALGVEMSSGARDQVSWREALFPNTGMPFRVRSTDSFTSLRAARRLAFRRAAVEADLPADRAARLLGASLVVSTARDAEHHGTTLPALGSSGPFLLLSLDRPPPWAAVYGRVKPVSPEQALPYVLDPAFDPNQRCAWEGDADDLPAGGDAVPARLVHGAWDELSFEVESEGGGVLVVREAYADGWEASVDGNSVAVSPADYLFRGVRVPPGRHQVTLRYAVRGRFAGTGISLLCVCVAGAAFRRKHGQITTNTC